MTPSPRDLGVFLWRASISERLAVGIFHQLAKGALLRADERRPLERFTEDEVRHGNQLRECARQYLPQRPLEAAPLTPLSGRPEHVALATLTIAERLSAPSFSRALAVFSALGDTASVATYERITSEEAAHIAWGRNVLARIYREGGQLAAEVSAFRRSHETARQYRATRADRQWLVRA